MVTPFKFDNKLSLHNDPLDLTSFNVEVPKPDALVDIVLALKEFRRDVANIQFMYRDDAKLSFEANWKILLNHRDWSLFWSERHPNAGERAREARALHEFNGSIRRIAAKARAKLAGRLRQGAQPP